MFKFNKSLPIKIIVMLLLCMPNILLASTHDNVVRLWVASTAAETGIFQWILDDFKTIHPEINIDLHVLGALAVLEHGRKGEADLIITHHPASERLFVSEGYGSVRVMLMFNEFAFFGHPKYVAEFSKYSDILDVLKYFARDQTPFNVPDPQSGTYTKLTELWSIAGIQPGWVGYETTGASSVYTLKNAALFGNFAFADMGTYLANRSYFVGKLVPIYRDNSALRNYYSVILVNKDKFPNVNEKAAQQLFEYLISDRGQARITSFVAFGENLFSPAAHLDDGLKNIKAQSALRLKTHLIDLMTGLILILIVSCGIIFWLLQRSRRIEKLRSISEERYNLAVSGSNDGIWDWDITNNTAYISHRLNEILGLPSGLSKINDPTNIWRERVHPDDRDDFVKSLKQYLDDASGSLFVIEFRVLRTNDEFIWVLMRGKALRDTNGIAVRMSGSLSDITALKEHEALQHKALHDQLTGLPNRSLLFDRLNQIILSCNRNQTQFAVIMVDLDRFKNINDTHGHSSGDIVLQTLAQRFRNVLRNSDTIARIGGDEFVVILPNADIELTTQVIKKLINSLKKTVDLNGNAYQIHASFGAALFPDHGSESAVLIKHADAAMYNAKRSNSGFAFYEKPSSKSASA